MMARNESTHNNDPRKIPATHTNRARLPQVTTREINPTSGSIIMFFMGVSVIFILVSVSSSIRFEQG
jgi:hypothetical protein